VQIQPSLVSDNKYFNYFKRYGKTIEMNF